MVMDLIEGFQDGKLKVYDLAAFSEKDSCMLLRPATGTVLGIKRELLDTLREKKISKELAFTMIQRGLADYDQSRKVSACRERIYPDFFLIDLTKKCNLACRYCFREFADQYPKMTMEMIDRICDSLLEYWKRYPMLRLSIQAWGGEPLLCLPLIVHIRERFETENLKPQIVMETNATLMTERAAAELFRNHIELGISIDGTGEVHDLQRPFRDGSGSLASVLQGIDNLRKVGYEGFGTITVVTRDTISHLAEIIDFFSQIPLRSVKFNMMRKNERNKELAPDPKEFGEYSEKLLSCLYNLYQKRIPFVEQNVAQRMKNLMYRPNDNICSSCGCHGGFRMLSIDSVGKVFPCELSDYEDYCIGTVGERDYAEMVNQAVYENHEYFRERDLTECAKCPWQYYCRGGCKAAVKYAVGTPQKPDITECAFNMALYPRLVSVLFQDPGFAEYLMTGDV